MTQLAALVSRLWRCGLGLWILARIAGWRSLWRWAGVLLFGSTALAWSLTWVGGAIVQEPL